MQNSSWKTHTLSDTHTHTHTYTHTNTYIHASTDRTEGKRSDCGLLTSNSHLLLGNWGEGELIAGADDAPGGGKPSGLCGGAWCPG